MKKIILSIIVMLLVYSVAYGQPVSIEGYDIPIDIKINDITLKTPVTSFIQDDTVYVPLRAICEAFGANVSWNDETEVATVTRGDISIQISENSASNGITKGYMYHDSLCAPIRLIVQKFGFLVGWDNRYHNVIITDENFTLPDASIDRNAYSNDDILLLAKLIYAEAGATTFSEQLGIGSVVMNRVKSSSYPNTISGVIYDKKWAVQFPPAFDGSLDRDPSGIAIIAAKCAAHGVNNVGSSIGFTYTGDTISWITQNMKLHKAFQSVSFYE
ncbi:MAG: stalk domain-containing protein [Eubacteriales bacterium]|nr:stalk domain-containing protein [Eubacteriales bacterium]